MPAPVSCALTPTLNLACASQLTLAVYLLSLFIALVLFISLLLFPEGHCT